MRPPIEHAYTLEGEAYRLREATMLDGQQRISQSYALALTLAPGTLSPDTGTPLAYNEAFWAAYARTLESINGGNLYVKAITQECLVEAPDFWWLPQPVTSAQNGTTRRIVTFKEVTAALWAAHVQEVNVFLDLIFQANNTAAVPAAPAGPGEPDVVAPVETLPPMLRGRAE
jgi:hypothetical protein